MYHKQLDHIFDNDATIKKQKQNDKKAPEKNYQSSIQLSNSQQHYHITHCLFFL